MTLELTPEQHDDLKDAVSFSCLRLKYEIDSGLLTKAQIQTASAHKQRFASLHDLLNVPNTTVILHQS